VRYQRARTSLILILFALTVLNITGCASVSTKSDESSAGAKNFDPLGDKGVVHRYRKGRAVRASAAVGVQVNGIAAGGTGPGMFFRWELRPGTFRFLSSTGESSATVSLDVEAWQFYLVDQPTRMGADSGRVTMHVRDARAGEYEVKGCNLAVSAYWPG
jgi:hypothetical protein